MTKTTTYNLRQLAWPQSFAFRYRELFCKAVIGEVIWLHFDDYRDRIISRIAHELGIRVRAKRITNDFYILWRLT